MKKLPWWFWFFGAVALFCVWAFLDISWVARLRPESLPAYLTILGIIGAPLVLYEIRNRRKSINKEKQT